VHRALGEQLEDRGTDITAPATAAAASASARTDPGAEAEAGAETGTTETAAERAVMACGLFADVIAELTAGAAPLIMQGPTIAGAEAETEAAGAEGGIGGCEWGVHG
jgi:hypothetical protein